MSNTSALDCEAELIIASYGAFDTPNRMPQLYYHWIPYASFSYQNRCRC